MNAEQYARWKEFSLAMARGGWEKMTRKRQERLASEIETFFSCCFEVYKGGLNADALAVVNWDRSEGANSSVCGMADEFFASHYNERETAKGEIVECGNKFLTQATCCIRAGLDVAAEPSAGVVGFDIGDLRRMFGGTIPEWVCAAYGTDLNAAQDAESVWL